MAKTVAQYQALMIHALGGSPDARLDLLGVLNEAVQFVVNIHDWKFRRRPILDLVFTPAPTPAAANISAIARANNTVSVTLATPPVPALQAGVAFTVAGVADTTYNGSFTAATVADTTHFTYLNTGANSSSSGGTVIATSPAAFLSYVTLPADVAEITAITTKNNAIANVLICTLEEIAYRRGSPNAIAYDGLYRACLSFPTQADTTHTMPQPQLEIWPTPTASSPLGDLSLTYRGGAVQLVNQTDVPNIPAKLERLITLTARLFVLGYEEGQLQEDKLWQNEFAAMKAADGRQELTIGQLKGGAVQGMNPVQIREFRNIPTPQSRL